MKNLLTKLLIWLGLKPVTEVSVKTLDSLTAQQVFDFVKNHLLKQNVKAIGGETCKYRVETHYNGVLKCAAGCLIPDDIYRPAMEGTRYYGLVGKYDFSSKHLQLIEDLQTVHDSDSVKDWPDALENIAKKYKLEYND